jgi:hypothetical protein
MLRHLRVRQLSRRARIHHLDPSQKRLEINAKGVAVAIAKLREEAQKCVLLCANCHVEVERGVRMLPATVRESEGEYDSTA